MIDSIQEFFQAFMHPENQWLRVGLQMLIGISIFWYFWLRLCSKRNAQNPWHIFLVIMGFAIFSSSYLGLVSLHDTTAFTVSCISVIIGTGMIIVNTHRRTLQHFGAALVIIGVMVFISSFSSDMSPPISNLRFYRNAP